MGVLREAEPQDEPVELAAIEEETAKPAVIPYDELPLPHELEWGQSYRVQKSDDRKVQVKQKHSPINVPFKLCRALQRSCKKRKCPCPAEKSVSLVKISLADRSALSQSQYMDLLSIPNRPVETKPKKRKKKCRKRRPCRLEPCPPRLVQMSVPKRRYVLENWKEYQYTLPAEIITRFDRIVNSGNNNLEPEEARYYFKKLDRAERKRKRALKRRRRKKKKPSVELEEAKWIEDQIDETVDAIVEHIKKEPLYLLNYKQMMVSNALLGFLCAKKIAKVKSRRTKCLYKKNIIDISDKFVRWMDSLATIVDLQPLMSKEELALLEISSVEELGEEEEYESEESEEESEVGSEFYMGEGEGDQLLDEFGEYEEFDAKKIVDKSEFFGEGEGEGSTLDFLSELDDDVLQRLIAILSESSDEFLDTEIDPENLPQVTYREVLTRLQEIHDGKLPVKEGQPLLADIMLEWAKNNEPEQVDDKIQDKIIEVSELLSDLLGRKRPLGAGEQEEAKEAAEDEVKSAVETVGEEKEGIPGEGQEEAKEGGVEEEFSKEAAPSEQEGAPKLALEDEIIPDSEFDDGARPGDKTAEEEGEAGEEAEEEEEGDVALGEEEEEGAGDEGAEFEGGLEDEESEGEEFEGAEGEEIGEEELEGEEVLEEAELGEEEEEAGIEGEELEGLKPIEEVIEEPREGKELAAVPGAEGEPIPTGEEELWGEGVIKGHKPPVTFEHSPDTICCLSLKIWAVWLLEVAQNAHNWTKWTADIIRQVRHFAAIVRGDVKNPDGTKRILYKEEWRRFVRETAESINQWREYSAHVQSLSDEIIDNFHGKKVICCPKCLQDHMIKDVCTAHETLKALTEAINSAAYWQKCLNGIVEKTRKLIGIPGDDSEAASQTSEVCSTESSSSSGQSAIEISEIQDDSSESLYEIEEIDP